MTDKNHKQLRAAMLCVIAFIAGCILFNFTWVGEIQSILCDTASVGAIIYDVLGYYEPIKDKDGYVDSYWDEFDSNKASKKPKLRQLRGDYLIKLVESTD